MPDYSTIPYATPDHELSVAQLAIITNVTTATWNTRFRTDAIWGKALIRQGRRRSYTTMRLIWAAQAEIQASNGTEVPRNFPAMSALDRSVSSQGWPG